MKITTKSPIEYKCKCSSLYQRNEQHKRKLLFYCNVVRVRISNLFTKFEVNLIIIRTRRMFPKVGRTDEELTFRQNYSTFSMMGIKHKAKHISSRTHNIWRAYLKFDLPAYEYCFSSFIIYKKVRKKLITFYSYTN